MKKEKLTALLLTAALLLTGCLPAGTAPQLQDATLPAEVLPSTGPTEAVADVLPEAQALLEEPPAPPAYTVLEAQPSGEREQRTDRSVIDYSHADEGYVMALYPEQTEKRLKVLVQGPTTRYSYNLTPGQWTVFPLSDGNGSYEVGIYENISGTRYSAENILNITVEMADEFAPFLRPNQYVDYSVATEAVALAAELCREIEDPLEKVEKVYDYVVATLSYDYDRAANVKSGYLPDLDQVLADQKGICFDYAALMAAMLRSQQVPCKLVIGYAEQTYHAWISVWTEDSGWVDGIIFFDGQIWKRMDPTFASTGEQSEEIMNYIDRASYREKYLY